jgi:hypothetical protein
VNQSEKSFVAERGKINLIPGKAIMKSQKGLRFAAYASAEAISILSQSEWRPWQAMRPSSITSARPTICVFNGVPAPYNLPVPPDRLLSETMIRIGENPSDSNFEFSSIRQI